MDKLYFRAAIGNKIEAAGEGWYKIDGWKMKVESALVPTILAIGRQERADRSGSFQGWKGGANGGIHLVRSAGAFSSP